MIRAWLLALAASFTLLTAPAWAQADGTEVVVRVISQDAKWVGDLTGGAEVRLVDVATGKLLAEGKVTGSTGDTPAIMAAQGRAPLRATEGSAAFRTTLAITQPTLVRVEVKGPLGVPETMQRATSERWLIPGTSMAGTDGWVVELPGLAIRLVDAPPVLKRGTAQAMKAHVQLMCGCPITPGGMWAAEDYVVTATVRWAAGPEEKVPMPFAEAPGRFALNWTPMAKGPAELTISAINRRTGNAGVLRQALVVE